MSGLRIFKNGWTHLGCDSFLCNQSPTTWGVGVPDGPPGQHQHFCEADMQELIANLPDALLPTVGALVIKHVQEGTEWGQALVEKIAEALPEEEPAKADPEMALVRETWDRDGSVSLGVVNGDGSVTELQRSAPGTVAIIPQSTGDAWGRSPIETLMPYVQGAVATAPAHACICGWDPKEGSTNPDRDLKAHQRFCEAAKAEKGADA